MRGFLIIVVVAGLGFIFMRQKHADVATTAAKPVSTQPSAASGKPAPAPALTPAPRGQASEFNYMKRALDRAADVRDQARGQTKAGQDP
jgi:hypothetical protein